MQLESKKYLYDIARAAALAMEFSVVAEWSNHLD
jgi:hypothetical protein